VSDPQVDSALSAVGPGSEISASASDSSSQASVAAPVIRTAGVSEGHKSAMNHTNTHNNQH